MAGFTNGNELESVRGWIKGAKFVLNLLEHARAHLEEVAEDEEEQEAVIRPAPEPVPVAAAPAPAPPPPPPAATPQERAKAAMHAAGYGPTSGPPRQPRGRTFVTPGLRQAIVDAARRRPKPTIAILAQEFDVSTATVSRILRQIYERGEDQEWEGPGT